MSHKYVEHVKGQSIISLEKLTIIMVISIRLATSTVYKNLLELNYMHKLCIKKYDDSNTYLNIHSSGSQQSACNSTALYPFQGRISPHM